MKEDELNEYKEQLNDIVAAVEMLYNMGVLYKLTNEQYFLDWLDKLNEISVRH